MRRLLACLALLLLAGAVAPAAGMPLHRYQFNSWATEAGLPQVSVYDTAFDTDGFLWIATEQGLSRFDGVQFTNFDRGTTPALASSWITRLHRGASGRLWVATVRNLLVMQDGRLVERAVDGPAPGRVHEMLEDGDGKLWLAGDGLYREQGGRIGPAPGWSGPATALAADADGVWVAGANGLVAAWNGRAWRAQRFAQLDGTSIQGMVRAGGHLWLASSGGLFRLRGEALEAFPLTANGPQPNLTAIAADAGGAILLGSDSAFFRVRGGQVERLDGTLPGGFQALQSIRTGPGGSIWLGSQQHGLRHMWPDRVQRLGAAEGLRDLRVWGFAQAPGALMVGHNAGFDYLQGERFTPGADSASLPNPVVYTAMTDTLGRRWLGTRKGLVRTGPDGAAPRSFAALEGLQVTALKERAGVVWAGTGGGLFRIEGDHAALAGAEAGLDKIRVRALLLDRAGQLWVGAESGLFRQAGAGFKRIADPLAGAAYITSLAELSNGAIVAGSLNQGMFVLDGQGWRQLDRARGLPVDSVFFLSQDRDQLVFSHIDGAYRLPVSELTHKATSLSHLEILLLDQGERLGQSRVRCCNYGGNGKAVIDGKRLLLATLNGVAQIDLHAPAMAAPRLAIRAIRHAQGTQAAAPAVSLPQGARDLNIDFGAIDFRYPQLLNYRYRLAGFDAGWIESRARATAIYTNLPPGRWRFEAQARHQVQDWGPSSAIELEVPAYFHEGWPAKLLLAAALAGLMLLFFRWRLRRLVRQKRALEAEVGRRVAQLAAANEDLARTNGILARASVTDTLTGLHNRRYMEEQAPLLLAALARSRQGGKDDSVLGFILVDIDHFKGVNDSFGHAVGDEVLCKVARALEEAARDTDYLMRWGGEEFLLVLQNSERGEVVRVAERMRAAVQAMVTTGGPDPHPVTVSVGYAGFPLEGAHLQQHHWSTALALADRALYAAKEHGRNCVASIVLDLGGRESWSDQRIRASLADCLESGRARLVLGPGSSQDHPAASVPP